MKFTELAKQLTILDCIILNLDEKGFSGEEIASITGVTRQSVHNCKKRNESFLEALKSVKTPPTEYGDPNINLIVNVFAGRFGVTKTTKYDRFAAKRLHDKYTAKQIVKVIDALSDSQSDKYAPTVGSVSQFETKLPNIMSYFAKKQSDQVISL